MIDVPRRSRSGVECSCGWTGRDWSEAKEHIVEAMKANEREGTATLHEVVRYGGVLA